MVPESDAPKPPQTLEGRLRALIARFEKEAKKHKRLHRGLQVSVLLLTMLTTIVAGYGLSEPSRQGQVQLLLIILSATTTAVAGYASLRRAGELWQIEKTVSHRLQDLDLEVVWLKSVGRWDIESQERVLERIFALLASSAEEWRARVQTATASSPEASRTTPPGADDRPPPQPRRDS
jgi:hypothetical protein